MDYRFKLTKSTQWIDIYGNIRLYEIQMDDFFANIFLMFKK